MVSFLYPHPTLLFELETSEVNRGSLKQPILQRKSPNFSRIFIELQEVSRRLFELVGKMKMSSFRWYHFYTLTQHYFLSQRPQKLTAVAESSRYCSENLPTLVKYLLSYKRCHADFSSSLESWKDENVLFQMVSFLYPHPTLLFELETSEVNRGSLKQPILQRKSPNFSQIFIELQEVSRRLFELVGKMKMSSFRWYHFYTLTQHYFLSQRPQKLTAVAESSRYCSENLPTLVKYLLSYKRCHADFSSSLER